MDSKGNPLLAVDAIIRRGDGKVALIQRKYEPHGWAIPGGIVDEGESCEDAVVREAKEETSLDVRIVGQLHTYSDPARDPRKHVVSVVFVCDIIGGEPKAADDAIAIEFFDDFELPDALCFDHSTILMDYFEGPYRKK